MNKMYSREYIQTCVYTMSAAKGKRVNRDKHYEGNVHKLK